MTHCCTAPPIAPPSSCGGLPPLGDHFYSDLSTYFMSNMLFDTLGYTITDKILRLRQYTVSLCSYESKDRM